MNPRNDTDRLVQLRVVVMVVPAHEGDGRGHRFARGMGDKLGPKTKSGAVHDVVQGVLCSFRHNRVDVRFLRHPVVVVLPQAIMDLNWQLVVWLLLTNNPVLAVVIAKSKASASILDRRSAYVSVLRLHCER